MTRVYDNWERLVEAVLKREQLRLIALAPSRDTSFSSSISADSNPLKVDYLYDEAAWYIFRTAIGLANQVMEAADDASSFKQECVELKSKTQTLAWLLHQAARVSNSLYDRPMRFIMSETERVLNEAVALVLKCRGVKRLLTMISTASFRKMSYQLENSIGDVSWLLQVAASTNDRDNEDLGLPPIATNEPILSSIWVQITILYTGSIDDQGDAAASLVSLARENDRHGKLIIEEGGVRPLLKLIEEGKPEGQENAARAIGLLGKDPESVEHMSHAGVCSVFAKILKAGAMKLQAVVAWAVSEFASHHPECQYLFVEYNIIRLLIGHLALEHSKYAVVSKVTSMQQAVVLASNNNDGVMKDPSTKAYIKAMAARALGHLAKGNLTICRSITETRALLCFADLLEKGPEEVQYNSAMALMEITAVAEKDSDLRRSAFKPNSPACKAVVDQLCGVLEKADSVLLVPCIKAIGNLACAFRATETRMISPLVMLLADREAEVSKEACIALTKFACRTNYLSRDRSKAIIEARGAKPLVELVYFGEQMVQSCALILLCYIASNVPDSKELAQAEVILVLEWASKQASLMQAEDVEELLPYAKAILSRALKY